MHGDVLHDCGHTFDFFCMYLYNMYCRRMSDIKINGIWLFVADTRGYERQNTCIFDSMRALHVCVCR